MLTEPLEQTETIPALLQPGKDEMNFAEFPIALLTDRVPKGQKSIKFEDEIYDARRKKLVPRKRIIEGSEEYGLPTATDDTVILALIQLTKQKSDFTQRALEFSRLELIHLLGWPNEGKSYDRIKISLLRIKGVNYVYDNAWWDSRLKAWTTRAFNIIDNVEINDSRTSDGQGGLFPSRIVWNEIVFDSFKAGFVRDIDFQLCMRLEHPTALRMYRFLGKRFYLRPDWTFDLKEFAYIHMNLGRNYEGGTQIARKLKPAITELESVGFLEPLAESERFPKKGREWSIRLVKKAQALSSPAVGVPAHADPVDTVQAGAAAELITRGVGKAKAADLVKQHPADAIAAKIEVFDWLAETQEKRVAKNPAGYLVKSIEDEYGTPKGFTSKADRQRREEARQAKERQAAEERRRQKEQEASDLAERKAIAAYWESLTPEEQAKLDDASCAQATPESMAFEDGPFKEMGQRIRRNDYIRQLLKSREPMPAQTAAV